jgi:RNA recognition motif-containing protein
MRPRLAPPPPQPVPAPSITGNATNDPTTANKRVFVGNLNTIAISKEEVERMFGNYGIITGISMHKGYAFVQFAYEHEARVACGSEDGKTYAGQKLGKFDLDYKSKICIVDTLSS